MSMPFAGYEDFDACVVDNADKNNPEAYCAAIQREVEGEKSMNDIALKALDDDLTAGCVLQPGRHPQSAC